MLQTSSLRGGPRDGGERALPTADRRLDRVLEGAEEVQGELLHKPLSLNLVPRSQSGPGSPN